MSKFIALLLAIVTMKAADLPTKKYLNQTAIKTMVAVAEAEADKRGVHVSICIVDDGGNFLFFERRDGAALSTVEFAQRKARDAAFYKSPSKSMQDQVKSGNLAVLAFPNAFPNQGGLPIQVDGQTLGGIAVSGAKSEVDEAIGQTALDALRK